MNILWEALLEKRVGGWGGGVFSCCEGQPFCYLITHCGLCVLYLSSEHQSLLMATLHYHSTTKLLTCVGSQRPDALLLHLSLAAVAVVTCQDDLTVVQSILQGHQPALLHPIWETVGTLVSIEYGQDYGQRVGGGRWGMGVDCVVYVFTLVTLCCQVFYLDSLLLSFFSFVFLLHNKHMCVWVGVGGLKR